MLGLIAAMELEMEGLRALMDAPVTRREAGVDFVLGRIEGREVVTAVCGVGKVAAAMCTEAMIALFRPEAVLCTGVAGSLSPALGIGSVIVADAVVQHDLDITGLGTPLGTVPGLELIEIPSDPALREKLRACAAALGFPAAGGIIASGDQFISSAEKKAFLAGHFGAAACEMEGGAIAQVCRLNAVPFCVLRAISDSADDDSAMDYPSFVRMAAARSVALMHAFLRA